MLNKFFLFLFLVLIFEAPAGASSSHDVQEKTLLVKSSMKIHDADLVYILTNPALAKLEKIGNDYILTGLRHGTVILQVYKKTGLFETYRLKIRHEESFKTMNQAGNQGYRVYWRNAYTTSTGSQLTYRHTSNFGLKTRVGTQSSFEGNVRYSNFFKMIFDVHFGYKNFKYSYGDLNIKSLNFGTISIVSPILRQHILSGRFLNNALNIDIWTGKISPAVVNGIGLQNASMDSNDNPNKAQISGFNILYKKPNNRYFLTGMNNSLNSYYLAMIGAEFFNKQSSLTIGAGKSSEGENLDIRASHDFMKNKWTLQRVSASYAYSPNGYNSLWFSFPFISESFRTSLSFYNPNMFKKEGSFFTNLNYSHDLRGVNLSRQVRATTGWRNKNYLYEIFYSKQHVITTTLDDPMIYGVYGAKASALLKENGDWKIKSDVNYTNGYNLMNDFTSSTRRTRLNLTSIYQNRLTLGAMIGHNKLERQSIDRDRMQAGARIIYQKDKVRFQLSHNVTFAKEGNQARTTANINYVNKNHNVGLRYTLTSDGNRSRNYSLLGLYYTVSFGDDKKSLFKVFDTNKVSGSVFDDKNLNGIQDEGEDGIKGLVVILTSGAKQEKTFTNSEGIFKFSGLDNGLYKLSIEDASDLYTIGTFPEEFKLSNTEDYTASISARRERSVDYLINSSITEYFNAEIWCEDSKMGTVLVKTNEKRSLKVPLNKECQIKTNLVSLKNYDYSLYPEVLELTTNQSFYETKMLVSRKIMGQIFLDKNNNGKFEIGEEISGDVLLGKDSVSTNKNGFFFYSVGDKINKIIFKGVKKHNCSLKSNEIMDFTGKKILLIPCNK